MNNFVNRTPFVPELPQLPPKLPPALPDRVETSAPQQSNMVLWSTLLAFVVLMLFLLLAPLSARKEHSAGDHNGRASKDIGVLGGSPSGNPFGSSPLPPKSESAREAGDAGPQSISGLAQDANSSESAESPSAAETKEKTNNSDDEDSLTTFAIRNRKPKATGSAAPPIQAAGENPFESASDADRIIYIIDKSSSMAAPMPPFLNNSRSNFARVCEALMQAIDSLKPNQHFTVFLFDSFLQLPPSGAKLVPANKANQDAFRQWLSQTFPDGGTEPMEALMRALELKPDKIVLLSDGEFDPMVVAMVTDASQKQNRPTRIDCIGLVEQVETLRQLAIQNYGVYYQAR